MEAAAADVVTDAEGSTSEAADVVLPPIPPASSSRGYDSSVVDINDPMIMEPSHCRTPSRDKDGAADRDSPSPSPDHGGGGGSDGITSPGLDDDSEGTPATKV